jgi:hypothetical protein
MVAMLHGHCSVDWDEMQLRSYEVGTTEDSAAVMVVQAGIPRFGAAAAVDIFSHAYLTTRAIASSLLHTLSSRRCTTCQHRLQSTQI